MVEIISAPLMQFDLMMPYWGSEGYRKKLLKLALLEVGLESERVASKSGSRISNLRQ